MTPQHRPRPLLLQDGGVGSEGAFVVLVFSTCKPRGADFLTNDSEKSFPGLQDLRLEPRRLGYSGDEGHTR